MSKITPWKEIQRFCSMTSHKGNGLSLHVSAGSSRKILKAAQKMMWSSQERTGRPHWLQDTWLSSACTWCSRCSLGNKPRSYWGSRLRLSRIQMGTKKLRILRWFPSREVRTPRVWQWGNRPFLESQKSLTLVLSRARFIFRMILLTLTNQLKAPFRWLTCRSQAPLHLWSRTSKCILRRPRQ